MKIDGLLATHDRIGASILDTKQANTWECAINMGQVFDPAGHPAIALQSIEKLLQ